MSEKTRETVQRIAREAQQQPIAQWLGYEAFVREGHVLHRLNFHERHIGNPLIRALHGGVVAAFMEFAALRWAAASMSVHVTDLRLVSTDINYLQSTVAGDLTAKIEPERVGRRMAFLSAIGWQEDETTPVASARMCVRLQSL